MTDRYRRIQRDPEIQRLATARTRLAWLLFAVTMVFFLTLLTLVAFFPDVLATPLGPGRVATIAWPFGAAVIFIRWLFTVIYVHRANAEGRAMDAIVRKVLA